jgi:uncharacterized membrane protein (DUF106 family)
VLAGLIALALSPVTRPGIPVLVAVVAALVVGVVSTRPLKDAR